MFTYYIALVSESPKVPFGQVAAIAAAVQKQVTRDFAPIWNIQATVNAYERLEDMPSDYWPVLIMDNIGFPGAAGIHLDRNGQPYALVQASLDVSLTVSHEVLEMLADPFGNRLVASHSIKPGQGRVNYLVEVCDPSEDKQFGYTVNGITLSDFYTPNYFDPVSAPSVRYSFTGALKAPREVIKGGYLSWMLPETGEWFQAIFFGSSLSFRSLGVLQRNGHSIREMIDAQTFEPVEKTISNRIPEIALFVPDLTLASITEAASGTASHLRADIKQLLQQIGH